MVAKVKLALHDYYSKNEGDIGGSFLSFLKPLVSPEELRQIKNQLNWFRPMAQHTRHGQWLENLIEQVLSQNTIGPQHSSISEQHRDHFLNRLGPFKCIESRSRMLSADVDSVEMADAEDYANTSDTAPKVGDLSPVRSDSSSSEVFDTSSADDTPQLSVLKEEITHKNEFRLPKDLKVNHIESLCLALKSLRTMVGLKTQSDSINDQNKKIWKLEIDDNSVEDVDRKYETLHNIMNLFVVNPVPESGSSIKKKVDIILKANQVDNVNHVNGLVLCWAKIKAIIWQESDIEAEIQHATGSQSATESNTR